MKNPLVWIVVLLVLLIVLLLGVVLGWWTGSGNTQSSGTATPSVTPTDTAAPTETETPSEFVARDVSTAPHLPSANELTAEVLAGVGANWVVAIYNSDAYDDAGSFTAGESVLYLISPVGQRYELANLDDLGFDSPNIVAWDYDAGEILLFDNPAELAVFNMASGALTSGWTFCDGSAFVTGRSVDGDWLLRGSCDEAGLDGLYDSAGVLLESSIVGNGFGESVRDVGAVQVLFGFETPAEERFHAYYPDGTDAFLIPPAGLDCYPIEKGRGATLAITCWDASATMPSVWELPVDGSPATRIVTAAETTAFRDSLGYGPDDYIGIFGYCADSVYRVLEFEGYESRLGVVYGDALTTTSSPPFVHQRCHGADGTRSLISGNGPLWWEDWDTGAEVELLPGSDELPLYVVGAADTTAIAHPGS